MSRLRRPVLWLGLALWGLTVPAGVATFLRLHPAQPPLPTLGPAPDFSLTSQDGSTFALADLTGRITVVDFIFTRCPDVCPLMTTKMAWLSQEIPPSSGAALPVEFLSVSVDPEWDTPARLTEYGDRYGVDHARWHLLTGSRDAVEAVVDGFRQGQEYTGAFDQAGVPDIRHSQRFILVDQYGMVRGFYHSDASGLRRLAEDARSLASEGASLTTRAAAPTSTPRL